MKVYLDDLRPCPDGWILVKTVEETISLLESRHVTELSLDNDLGPDLLEGWRVCDYLEDKVYFDPNFPIPIITIHSANASRVLYMSSVIVSIKRIRDNQLKNNKKEIQ